MKPKNRIRRFIFHTRGVCPPEIHFQLNDRLLEEIRFVGGGCPGNAQLVSRLIKGKTIDDILPLLRGIKCREQTSCPDQLAVALEQASTGTLLPAETLRIMDDPVPRKRVGLIGVLDGNSDILDKIISSMQARKVEAAYCMGNFTGKKTDNGDVIRLLKRQKELFCIQGERDWSYGNYLEEGLAPLRSRDRDWIAMLPQVMTFQLGDRKAVAFYGDYLQHLPGYSDFGLYGLEINMVCGLTDFMGDETVFPALEAMIPQFESDLIFFGQRKDWGRWCIGEKEFFSVGRSLENDHAKWGLLEVASGGVRFETIEEKM
ncbi:MAG: TIGR03905 family TSCPD domain-containing protein [Deltaproteobacteria bacterium]|nr:TIGR03905 family TSCPD domain-containing protein [Deltaproteobacteria bacterium]